MNNEPVAWIDEQGEVFSNPLSAIRNKAKGKIIPLYTHPVKEKGLPLSSPSPMNQAFLTSEDNCKPYGYVWTSLKNGMETKFTNMYPNEFYKPFDIVPLYTHPVKELTDEEILKEAESYGMGEKFIQDAPLFHAIKFARAILRKAQEK